eukprot:g14508.t1
MQGGETSALLEVTATTTTDNYEKIGRGVCACRHPTRQNGLELDLCNSDVSLLGHFKADPAPEDFCRRLCSDAADCMAYQVYEEPFNYYVMPEYVRRQGVKSWCLLWMWHRVPIGVLGAADITVRSDFSNRLKYFLEQWLETPCMRKVVQLTDRRSRFQLESVEKFAIMPREEDGLEWAETSGVARLGRLCTCRATTPTGGDDTEEKETVCRVADERANMSQEAAESLCLERNRREAALLRDRHWHRGNQ